MRYRFLKGIHFRQQKQLVTQCSSKDRKTVHAQFLFKETHASWLGKHNTCSSHLSWTDESFLFLSWGTQYTNTVAELHFWPCQTATRQLHFFLEPFKMCYAQPCSGEMLISVVLNSFKNLFPVNPSKLHHMALNLWRNEHLYTLERSDERFVLSNLLGSCSRAAFYHPAQFWPVNSNWSTRNSWTVSHITLQNNVWII